MQTLLLEGVPADIVILRVEGHGDREKVEELNLDLVPDSEFAEMREGLTFVKEAIQNGYKNAVAEYGFNLNDDYREERISYKITSRTGSGAINLKS